MISLAASSDRSRPVCEASGTLRNRFQATALKVGCCAPRHITEHCPILEDRHGVMFAIGCEAMNADALNTRGLRSTPGLMSFVVRGLLGTKPTTMSGSRPASLEAAAPCGARCGRGFRLVC